MDQDRRGQLICVITPLLSISVISVIARFFARTHVVKFVGVDDWLILAALLFTMAHSILILMGMHWGLGRSAFYLSPQDVDSYSKVSLVAAMAYSVAAMFIKLSLLSFYTRLVQLKPVFRISVFFMMAVSIALAISSIATMLLQCIPLSKAWVYTKAGQCINIKGYYIANTSLNALTDIIIYALPIPVLWGLKLPLRQRLSLCFIFSIGGVAVAAGLVRAATIKNFLTSTDLTLAVVTSLIWSAVEINVAIFAACFPAYKVLLIRLFPNTFGSSTKGNRVSKSLQSTVKSNSKPVPMQRLSSHTMGDEGEMTDDIGAGSHCSNEQLHT